MRTTWLSRSSRGCSWLGAAALSFVFGAGCADGSEPVQKQQSPLVAVCAESAAVVPDGGWICGTARTFECDQQPGTASPETVYVVREDGCDGVEYSVVPGPFALGKTEIVVSERVAGPNGGTTLREVCRSELSVVDTTRPAANPLRARLWPPNHKLHAFTAEQCAGTTDVCDPAPDVRFSIATSDEPADAEGDGSQAPDVLFDGVNTVSLRAERQGVGNGRVYVLGWSAIDSSGNAAQGLCTVEVPHDSSGNEAIADAISYLVPAPEN
jgi:hypothetical protein